ncbi:MAG: hypothetical protein GY867_13150 [bacterium]|nr:hypothetical protein [bacterium]
MENKTGSLGMSGSTWGIVGIAAAVIVVIVLGVLVAAMFGLDVGEVFN